MYRISTPSRPRTDPPLKALPRHPSCTAARLATAPAAPGPAAAGARRCLSLGFGQGVDVDHVDRVRHDAVLDGQLEEPAACGMREVKPFRHIEVREMWLASQYLMASWKKQQPAGEEEEGRRGITCQGPGLPAVVCAVRRRIHWFAAPVPSPTNTLTCLTN